MAKGAVKGAMQGYQKPMPMMPDHEKMPMKPKEMPRKMRKGRDK